MSEAGGGAQADAVRRRLAAERQRLTAVLDSTASPGSAGAGPAAGELSTADQHPAELGTETQYREQEGSVAESVRAELAELDDAERRVADGTYGRCAVCGAPIGQERLEALPATRFCREHA